MKKFYITTPIYYVNDKPHIGSAYTTIAADVAARFYRYAGVPTFFLTGTDEHGSKIEEAAKAAGKSPEDFAREMSAKFSFAWDSLGIAPDDFIRTTEERHKQAVAKFLTALKNSGKIYQGEYQGLYCVGHEAFMKETDLDAKGFCPDHKTKPQKLKEKNWFFKLSEFAEILKFRIQKSAFSIEPQSRRNEVLSFLEQGLEDVAISRPNVKWGIPLPWDANQTTYVWIEALCNYISALGYPSGEKYKKYWPADVHLVGKDIIRFHCLIWPALLEAVGLPWPKRVFAHGFFTVDGQKMSKSLGNAIDPNHLVAKFGSDAVRYFLLREIPFGEDGDFSFSKLEARYEGELANGLGNFASRVLALAEKYKVVLGDYYGEVKNKIEETSQVAFDKTSEFKFHDALTAIWNLLSYGDSYINDKKLWKRPDSKHVSGMLAILDKVAFLLAPYMPETSEKIRSALSAEKIEKPQPLFPRIESGSRNQESG